MIWSSLRRVLPVVVAVQVAAAASSPALGIHRGSPKIAGNATAGKAIFVSPDIAPRSCAGCHRLQAAGGLGTVGPDVDRVKPSYATIVRIVTKGVVHNARYPSGM